MSDKKFLVQAVFIDPKQAIELTLSEWDLLIRQARRAGVLARLALKLEELGLLQHIAEQPLKHLQSAMVFSQQFGRSLNWEILCIKKALDKKNIPLVLLKGAAYAENSLQVSNGRMFSDVDILVEKSKIAEVEVLLMSEGWMPSIFDEYDQNYYRTWMHEIPPLTHAQRNTSIDVHHNILPTTTKNSPEPEKLFSKKSKVKGKDVWVLCCEDQVLHSASHLFHEGEFRHGFRDLSDLHLLLTEFSPKSGFWESLLTRSTEIYQQLPLFLALRYSKLFFETSIPDQVIQISREQAGINPLFVHLFDFLFERALKPDHSSCNDKWTGSVRWFLYIRSQYLRMPLSLLIPHLLRKSHMRITGKAQH